MNNKRIYQKKYPKLINIVLMLQTPHFTEGTDPKLHVINKH